MAKSKSPYRQHIDAWKDCTRCELCKHRRTVVFARGVIPARILFIGEAPGISEDALGTPFIGPAGKLLDQAISQSGLNSKRLCFTNLVGCYPVRDDGEKRDPDPLHIEACSGKLRELAELCKPKAIVCVGSLAAKWVKRSLRCKDTDYIWADIKHPAFILRSHVTQKGLLYQDMVYTLKELALDV